MKTLAAAVLFSFAVMNVHSSSEFNWNVQNAKVDPNGDIHWAPQTFKLIKGASVRYIDYVTGLDTNDGLSKEKAWRHHPWDPEATGKSKECSGIQTYIFKGGVYYRGKLIPKDSGTDADRIILTCDPEWGRGQAVICGSEQVTGWKKGADSNLIPDKDKVWYADLKFAPRCVWVVNKDNSVKRLPLARVPNWKVSDPDDVKSEWWQWDNPGKPFDNYTDDGKGKKLHLGIDTQHIKGDPDYFKGAIIWSEYGWVMGTPYPVPVIVVDMNKKGLGFSGQWGYTSGSHKILRFSRYFLEDKPHYLDDPEGEFWFDKKDDGGRLYIRSPGGVDPNMLQVEAAKHLNLIDTTRMNNITVSNMNFRFVNPYWKLDSVPTESKDVDCAVIRLLGSGKNITISNCVFEYVHQPVYFRPSGRNDVIDNVMICDSSFLNTDNGAINISEGGEWAEVDPAIGRVYDVKILRNYFFNTGCRPNRYAQGHNLLITGAETLDVAGNVVDRAYGSGIHIFGGKNNWNAGNRPFTRILIHNNKVMDTLLNTNDWGGIETWQGGPIYVFNNISGNPGGYWNWNFKLNPKQPNVARFGHAYYLDGGFKNYLFNNIAWGKSKDPFSRLGNTSAIQEIHSYQNMFFNNTIYNFVVGSRRQAPQAGRDKFLGNIWQGIGEMVFRHTDPAKSLAEGNAADAGPKKDHFALETNAYANNVFADVAKMGVFEPSGRWLDSFDDFKKALSHDKSLCSELGKVSANKLLVDPEKKDFRPLLNSDAKGSGVRAFVPWSLYGVVAEWNFYPSGNGPDDIIDEHWYMTEYFTNRESYHNMPMYPLKGVNVTTANYEGGPLENWTKGSLTLNGKDQYAMLKNDEMNKSFDYTVIWKRENDRKETRKASGSGIKNPQIYNSNFLVEIYFKTVPDQKNSVLVEKMKDAGYSLALNAGGILSFNVKGKDSGVFALASTVKVNDGNWHHVIAEADRKSGKLNIYVDGKSNASGNGPDYKVSLENSGDLFVGGSPSGRCLNGSLEFLRISQGTLADAKTTIEELYAWEFNGPFLKDFSGKVAKEDRYAGAIEGE
ncbi:MAG TPA: hypothetical protein DCZ94_16465 [Lentisphaeria bacterium]|nr:MAG: hypothetical protein A2X48_01870 [Lentisphaerae bacterium GWF2_49_21]HBC88542.1 hypothetical protein [Lentisphaeria bacterium]